MPVPGVPTLQPVELPDMNPKQAGRAGATIAELGEESEGMVSQAFQIQAHIRNAQIHVDTIAAGNELDAAFRQMQIDLAKTTNSRDVPDTLQHAQDNLNAIQKKWEKSPAAIQIQQNAAALGPEMNQHAQMRQIDLMGKEWKTESQIQMQTLLPNMVSARRNGDKAQQDYINGYVSSIYDKAIQSGLITEADKTIGMNGFEIAVRKEVNEAAINSPNPQERRQAINQLTKGGSGPLDLTNLSPADINATLMHARETDERLSRLNEAQSINGVLNTMNNVFQSPEYKDNFEAQQKALTDGTFLKRIGAIAEDGSPDRVMAEKLSAEIERQRGFRKQEQDDQDNKALDMFEPMIYQNKLSEADINQIGGISPRARRSLISIWNQQRNINRFEAIQERQLRKQEQEDASQEEYANIMGDLMQGKVIEPLDIRANPNLLPKDKTQLLGALKTRENDPIFQTALAVMQAPFGKPKATDAPEDIAKYYSRIPMMYQQLQKDIEEKHLQGGDIIKDAEEIRKRAVSGDIADRLNKMFGTEPTISPWQGFKVAVGQMLGIPSLAIPKPESTPAPAAPKTPTRPQGVPSDAVWNPEVKRWQLPAR